MPELCQPLSAKQVSEFARRGFTVVPRFFIDREILAIQREVARWIDDEMFRDASTKPDEKQNLQVIPLYSRSRLFKSLVFAPKVVRAVEQLLGKPVVKILDQMFYKPPRSGMRTKWHTDNAYFGLANPLKGTAMWIAIDDANTANGTLKVIPDAFRQNFPHERDLDSDHHIRTHVDESRAVHCELAAGGVVFFCFGTPHATGDNLSQSSRAGVGIHFVNANHVDPRRFGKWESVQLSDGHTTSGVAEYGELCSFQDEIANTLHERP